MTEAGKWISLVTGASGALIVLLLGLWLFITDKITTTGNMNRLLEAAQDRYGDMKAQRDRALDAVEAATKMTQVVTEASKQALDLVRDVAKGGSNGP